MNLSSQNHFDGSNTLKTRRFIRKVDNVRCTLPCGESFWSVNSTEKSQEYSKAIRRCCMDGYFGIPMKKRGIVAALCGKAINIKRRRARYVL